ncbi:MAG: hypothetical protein ACOYU3_04975 [Bacillota bacterium]
MIKKIPVFVLCIILAALLGACVQSAPTSSATASATPAATLTPEATLIPSPTAQPTPSLTPTPTQTATPSGVTENKLGYVTDAYTTNGVHYIRIDYVEMYTGDEAIQKALSDHSSVVEKDENGNYYIPNDYYIRNVNSKLRTFPLRAGCTITVYVPDNPLSTKKITFSQFKALSDPLMHVNIKNGSVVSMKQQYVP